MLPAVEQQEKLFVQGNDVTMTEANVCGHRITVIVHK
jgi:hypothetical protein